MGCGVKSTSAGVLVLALVALTCVPACKKQEAPREAKKQSRQEKLEAGWEERSAVNVFAAALRDILDWRQAQPVPLPQAARTELLEKFQKVPVPAGLPEEIASTWNKLLEASRKLARGEEVEAAGKSGAEAAAALNRQLASLGYGDLRL